MTSHCGSCPVPARSRPCPAVTEGVLRYCELADPSGPAYRAEYRAWLAGLPTPATLESVRTCPDRGSVLPVSKQPECGCAELTECRAGRGKTPGAVTLAECLNCKG